jgi:PKD repeat protein
MKKFYVSKGYTIILINLMIIVNIIISGGILQAQTSSLHIYSDIDIRCNKGDQAGAEPGSDIPAPVYQNCIQACDSTTLRYYTDLIQGATYQWSFSGSAGFSPNANEVFIDWGQAGQANISLVVTYSDGEKDSVSRCVEIVESPTADFYTTPADSAGVTMVCLDQPVNFFDNSVNAVDWEWDFGNGTFFSGKNPPPQVYQNSGTYTVKLVVKNECNCPDTISQQVVVDALPGPEIVCRSIVCAGDTVEYSTPDECDDYDWTVDGGTIISSPQNSNSISVVWDDEADGLGSVTLDVTPCGGFCSVPTTISVPIIPTSAQISGDTVVCLNSFENYEVPKIPGTKYVWDINPGGQLQTGQGTNEISVFWNNPGNHTINVEYFNEFLGCGGSSKLNVFVAPEFYISGPTELCANIQNNADPFYAAYSQGFVNADWTITTPNGNVLNNYVTGSQQLSTYDWSDGPGTYQLMAVSNGANTCNDTAFFQVIVFDPPELPSIDGDSVICPGGTYSYIALPGNSGMEYNWSANGGNITPSSATGSPVSVEWNGSQPYSLSLVQSMAASPGCSSDTFTLNLNPIPDQVIAGPDTVCPDAGVTYTASPNQDINYQWSVSPPDAGSIISGNGSNSIDVIWYNSQTSATLNISYPDCPGLNTLGYPVAILPATPPNITQSGVLCENGQITLTSSNASSYSWTDNNNQSIGNNQSVIIDEPSNYNLTVQNSYGCMSSQNISIDEEPSPLASISSPFVLVYCDSPVPDITMYALDGSGYSFQWYQNGSPIFGATNSSYTTNQTGNYHVVVTLGSCSDTSNTLTISHTSGPCDGCSTNESVDFTVNQPVCNPVSFNGTISSGIGSYYWNFDDPLSGAANTSGSLNPTHTFTNAGFYNVTFYGMGLNNNPPPDSCTASKRVTVEIPVVADFDFSEACAGDTVLFSDLSSFTPGNNITSWNWNFGDPASGGANTSSQQDPYHIFTSPGQYIVSLSVSNGTCTVSHTDTVNIEGFTASVSASPLPVCEGIPVTFSASSTSGFPITSHNWDFGDGNTSMLTAPQKTFSQAGNYNVTLSLTNSNGCSASAALQVDVLSPVPADSIDITGSNPLCEGDSLLLTAQSSNSYLWSTGDTSQSVYISDAGDYYAQITDQNGCPVNTPPVTVQLIPRPDFEVTGTETVCEGQFIRLETNLSGQYDFQWYLDNNQIQYAQSHMYYTYGVDSTNEGMYTVVVTDQQTGCTFSDSLFVTVNPSPDNPVISANNPAPLCEGNLITLTVTNPDSSLSYVWNTGQGGTSIDVSTSGYYRVHAVNQYGCGTYSNTINIAPKPETECVVTGCYEFCDTLMPKEIPGPGGYASYNWLEIDTSSNSGTLTGTTQNLTIDSSGVFQLVLTNQYGCIDTSEYIEVDFIPCGGCDDLNVTASPAVDDNGNLIDCCVDISFENNYNENQLFAVGITALNGAETDFSLYDSDWTVQNITDSSFTVLPLSGQINQGNYQDILQICLSNTTGTQQSLVFNWYGQEPGFDTLCTDTVTFNCEPESNCLAIIEDSLYCEGDSLVYQFSVQNNSEHVFQALEINSDSTSQVQITPPILTFPPLSPGQTYGLFTVGLISTGYVPGDTVCFTVMAHDTQNPDSSEFCCTDEIEYCYEIPSLCNPCDSLNVSVMGSDLDCCWKLSLTNHSYTDILGVQTMILNSGSFATINNPLGSDWSTVYNGPGNISWIYTGAGMLPQQADLPEFCIEGADGQTSYTIAVNWLVEGQDGDSILCADTLTLDCLSDCMGIYQDSVYCDSTGQAMYTFSIYNNYHVDVHSFEFFQPSPQNSFGGQAVFTGTIPVNGVASYTIPVYGNPGDTICFRIKAYDQPEISAHYNCCTSDSVYCIVLPECEDCVPGIYGPDKICKGEKVELCLETCCEAQYIRWSTRDKEPCITVDEPGDYIVKWRCGREFYVDTFTLSLASPDSCENGSVNTNIAVLPVSDAGNRLSFYPNPVSGILKIDYTLTSDSKAEISMFNLDGKRIRSITKHDARANRKYSVETDLSGLPKSMYILRLTNDKGTVINRKLLKLD